MFGGVAFMLEGNMAVGVHKDSLMVRVGPDAHHETLAETGVSVFDITGRPMKGWLLVDSDSIANDSILGGWIDKRIAFAASLPPK